MYIREKKRRGEVFFGVSLQRFSVVEYEAEAELGAASGP